AASRASRRPHGRRDRAPSCPEHPGGPSSWPAYTLLARGSWDELRSATAPGWWRRWSDRRPRERQPHRRALAALERPDARLGHGGRGQPVVGGRAGAALAGGDGVDPGLELGVVGRAEPLAPVGRDGAAPVAVLPDDDGARVGERDRAGFADHLAAHVVAVAGVHE